MKANIRLSLFRKTAILILALLKNVIAKMTGNAFFPAPPHTMVQAQAKADELEVAIAEATDGSKASKQLRNQLADEAAQMLREFADYQRMVGKNDPVILSTGGFELAKQPEPIEEIGIPQRVKAVATDKAGQIEFRHGKVHGAHYYNVYKADTDPASGTVVWTLVLTTTRTRTTFTGLESYKPVWYCASAVGVNGEGLKSDAAMGRAA